MTLTDTSSISIYIMFEFVIINIGSVINAKILSDNPILAIIESISTIICEFVPNTNINILITAPKQLRQMMQQKKYNAMQENFQNLPNNYSYDNVNATHYSLNLIAAIRTRIEEYDVISFDLQPTHLIAVLFHVFDAAHTGFGTEKQLQFKFTNVLFFNRICL